MTEKGIICHQEVQFVDRECLLQACSESKHCNSVYFVFLMATVDEQLLSSFLCPK